MDKTTNKFAVVGIIRCDECKGERKVIATFDTKEKAEEYIERSKLSFPTAKYFGDASKYKGYFFKQISDLRYYDAAYVEEYWWPEHNPCFWE